MERPDGPLSLDEAQQFVLALVNHDRAEHDLPPVKWDVTAAKAAQRHVEDMTRHGFTAHWGTDGSVPEQRYTEAGGEQFVQENGACLFDGVERKLDPDPVFSAVSLEQIQGAFMAEVPPNDGHKQNILKKWHTHLGVGLAKPLGIDQPCMAQEFVDAYGEYDGLPERARVGQTITVAGEVEDPMRFGGVGVAWIAPAEPKTAEELLATSTYVVPEPYVTYFPEGYETPEPVRVEGNHFTIDVDLDHHGKPGRYEVSVWAAYPGAEEGKLDMVSLRTISVR